MPHFEDDASCHVVVACMSLSAIIHRKLDIRGNRRACSGVSSGLRMVGRLASLVLVSSALCMGGVPARGDVPNFSREILPILSENCFHCHGQDAKARKGDLRLDVEA